MGMAIGEMEMIWTVDGDETSWGSWADNIGLAPATPLMQELIGTNTSSQPGWALDLGCGTGRAFQPLVKAGYRVIGVDPTAKGIQMSRERVDQEVLDGFPLQASAARLPIRDDAVLFVYAVGILFHLSQKEMTSALREIYRVLCFDGKALLHFLDIDDWRRSLAGEIRPEEAPNPSYRAVVTCFCTKQTIQDWIEAAGLRLESLELRTSKSEAGEQRNWFASCRK